MKKGYINIKDIEINEHDWPSSFLKGHIVRINGWVHFYDKKLKFLVFQ